MMCPHHGRLCHDKDPSQADPITRTVITAINNMLIDLMAAMSHKDWLSRRQQQYHIFCGVSVTQIRKLQVSDLHEPHRRAAATKHNMCHSVRDIFSYMLCFTQSP